MGHSGISRRCVLGLPAYLAACWPEILAAQEHAHRAAQSGAPGKFEFLSPAQAAVVDAIAAQIIHSGDSPGAREAGAVYFIDRALTTFESEKKRLYAEGVARLEAQGFARLTSEQQIQALQAIEKTEFFQTIRAHTIMSFLASPEYGGNRDLAGWKWIGFEDRFAFEPPFGYYDAQE
ncbi:MAG: gluconate 2-dehydrogenase subunit 3 family protein [Acidobacteria bacterium]|nr:gluconate 2-dehydrogenase subunit 3 family protein [Acidobacteriota bacterium]